MTEHGDPQYARGKLNEIVRALATGDGRARERVAAAATTLFFAVTAEDFEGEARAEYVAITNELEKRSKAHGGYRMSNATASRIAHRILDLWHSTREFDSRR